MQIRLGNRQDEKAVRELLITTMHDSNLESNFIKARTELHDMERAYIGKDGTFLVAEDNGKVVGVAAARRESDTICELNLLCVLDDKRKTGLGKELLERVLQFAKRMDYQALQVAVSVTGTEAAAFLMHNGFKRLETGTSPDDEVWRFSFV